MRIISRVEERMGGVFGGAIDLVGRLLGVWMLYGVAMDYFPAVFFRLTGRRELPIRLQKPVGHVWHIGALFLGWWLVSH